MFYDLWLSFGKNVVSPYRQKNKNQNIMMSIIVFSMSVLMLSMFINDGRVIITYTNIASDFEVTHYMNYPQLGAAKLEFQSCKALGFNL